MNRRELLELAALDAFGLLDEYEAALYTRSFHQAPPGVQDELIQLQAELASDTSLLPEEEPSADLRQRVLERIAEAIEQESPGTAPLASIGRRYGSQAADVGADGGENGGLFTRVAAASHFWRAAAFVLCAVTVILALLLTESMRQASTLARIALEVDTNVKLESLIGPTIKDHIFDPSAQRIVLNPADADSGIRATVFLSEDQAHGMLVVEGLPAADEPYRLLVQDARGASHVIETFPGKDRLSGFRLERLDRVVLAGATWELTGPGGTVLARA